MELEYGAKVVDARGKVLGMVGHVVRDAWSGEITKFVVRYDSPIDDLFLSVDDVKEATVDKVILKIAGEDLKSE